MRWNGKTWAHPAEPERGRSPVSLLAGVHCTSAHELLRGRRRLRQHARQRGAEHADRTVGRRRRGRSCRARTSRSRTTARSPVSRASSATSCFAVGNYDTNTLTNTLVEHWDGATLDDHAEPEPLDRAVQRAVGRDVLERRSVLRGRRVEHGSLVERCNGTAWSIVASPNPTGATAVELHRRVVPEHHAVHRGRRSTADARGAACWWRCGTGGAGSSTNVPVPQGHEAERPERRVVRARRCAASRSATAKVQNRRPLIERYA